MTLAAIYLICLGLVWAFFRGADDRFTTLDNVFP